MGFESSMGFGDNVCVAGTSEQRDNEWTEESVIVCVTITRFKTYNAKINKFRLMSN